MMTYEEVCCENPGGDGGASDKKVRFFSPHKATKRVRSVALQNATFWFGRKGTAHSSDNCHRDYSSGRNYALL